MMTLLRRRQYPACPHCNKGTRVRKHGTSLCGFQRYYCGECQRAFQGKYIYQIYQTGSNERIE
ncbi:Transposase and inactivated derivatives [Budvicia aquatica]|uniref:Transposase and inactivated derivatives n=2 Tax=Budvicia aquatica TaxID=82979 RepID=A0A484ZHK2_9GAMM|nr:Transposase and inactivated derivatives [Budvicia aquatica]